MFPWDCVFPTATQALVKLQAVPSVNIPLWEALGWGMRSEPGPRTQGDSGLAPKSFAIRQMPSLSSYSFRDTEINSVFQIAGQDAAGSPNSCVLLEGDVHITLAQLVPVLWRQQRQPTHQSATQCNCRENLNEGLPVFPLGEFSWKNHFGVKSLEVKSAETKNACGGNSPCLQHVSTGEQVKTNSSLNQSFAVVDTASGYIAQVSLKLLLPQLQPVM